MPAYLIFRDYGLGIYDDGRTAWSQVGGYDYPSGRICKACHVVRQREHNRKKRERA